MENSHLVKLILPVQHMVHQLDDNGTMAMFSHGVLFRGGAEGHIRQYLIKEKNYLDAVICLQIFLRNEYPDLYFGLEESDDAKTFCLLKPEKENPKRIAQRGH
jgi:hypothetical protein